MPHAHELMRDDFILVDVDDTVASLIGQIARHEDCVAVVLDGTTYKGMAEKRWLLASRIDPSGMKLKNLITHRSKSKTQFYVPKLAPDTDLKEIARLMATADVHALPVIVSENKKEKVVGVVHALDVVKELRSSYKGVKAEDIASMRVITIDQDDEVGKAMNVMNKQGIGHVVVVDSKGKLVGILTLTDILLDVQRFPRTNVRLSRAASHQKGKHTGFGIGEKQDMLKLPVHNILTHVPNCSTVAPEDPVASAIDEMVEKGIASIVLIRKDVPVGIITVKDILQDFGKA